MTENMLHEEHLKDMATETPCSILGSVHKMMAQWAVEEINRLRGELSLKSGELGSMDALVCQLRKEVQDAKEAAMQANMRAERAERELSKVIGQLS